MHSTAGAHAGGQYNCAWQWRSLACLEKKEKRKKRPKDLSKLETQFSGSLSSMVFLFATHQRHNGCQRPSGIERCWQGTSQQLENLIKPGSEMHRKQECIYLGAFPPPRPFFLLYGSPILLRSNHHMSVKCYISDTRWKTIKFIVSWLPISLCLQPRRNKTHFHHN